MLPPFFWAVGGLLICAAGSPAFEVRASGRKRMKIIEPRSIESPSITRRRRR